MTLCLRTNSAIGKRSRGYTYIFFLPKGGDIELIFTLRAAVSELQADFQNDHIWAWNVASGKFPEVAHTLLSTPGGQNWACFRSTGSGFRDTGRFSKLPYLGMTLGHKKSKSCIYTLFLPKGIEIELIVALQTAVFKIRTDFLNCHSWAWNLVTDKTFRSCTHALFLPKGSTLILFSLYWQRFPRYGPIFKIAIFF